MAPADTHGHRRSQDEIRWHTPHVTVTFRYVDATVRRRTVSGMNRGRGRRCKFCRQPLPEDLPRQARYCCRAHRQRAHEARQADEVALLRHRLEANKRQVASYEDCLIALSRNPRYGREVWSAFIAAYLPMPDEPDDLDRLDRFTASLRQAP
jgi:hypothetical protein